MSESNKDKASGRKYGNATKWEDSPAQVKNREQRNKAHKKLAKEGKVKKGQDVDHVGGLGKGNVSSNLKAKSKHANRAYKRNSDHTQKR